jgi:hypothetical protein
MAFTLLCFAQRIYDLHRTITHHNWTRKWTWIHSDECRGEINLLALR